MIYSGLVFLQYVKSFLQAPPTCPYLLIEAVAAIQLFDYANVVKQSGVGKHTLAK